jgi:CRISPR/Cas system CMR-associated protein Cmr3 (group 5 of RAMP superfamily)
MKTNNIEEILEALEQNKIIKVLCVENTYIFKKEFDVPITFKKSEIARLGIFGHSFSMFLLGQIEENKDDSNVTIGRGVYFIYNDSLNTLNNISLQEIKVNYLVNCECEILN